MHICLVPEIKMNRVSFPFLYSFATRYILIQVTIGLISYNDLGFYILFVEKV